jgi:hypothetical protein
VGLLIYQTRFIYADPPSSLAEYMKRSECCVNKNSSELCSVLLYTEPRTSSDEYSEGYTSGSHALTPMGTGGGPGPSQASVSSPLDFGKISKFRKNKKFCGELMAFFP